MLVRAIVIAASVFALSACNMAGIGKSGENPEAAESAEGEGAAAPGGDGKPADASADADDGAKPEGAPQAAPQPAPSAKP